jgi:F-type H+-transporting ATPase subunit b
MRKSLLLIVFLLASLSFAPRLSARKIAAQETPSQKEADLDQEGDLMKWELINTGIFALLLGYGVLTLAPKFFQARSLEIQKAIKDATGLKIEADFRYSEVDKKMSNLSGEVARMKAEAAAEMEREHERMKRETAQELEHLDRNADYEIDFLRAEGAQQVKRHTAQLAFSLAERRLQAHFAQNDSQNNVREFVGLVGANNLAGVNK